MNDAFLFHCMFSLEIVKGKITKPWLRCHRFPLQVNLTKVIAMTVMMTHIQPVVGGTHVISNWWLLDMIQPASSPLRVGVNEENHKAGQRKLIRLNL